MNGFTKDLLTVYNSCHQYTGTSVSPSAAQQFQSTLSQISYSSLDWLKEQVDPDNPTIDIAGEEPVEKNTNPPNRWQEAMRKMIMEVGGEQQPHVPEFEITGADPKPKMTSHKITTGAATKIIKAVDISPEEPYLFSVVENETGAQYQISVIGRLGLPGKEGTVYRANETSLMGAAIPLNRAMKVYRKAKSIKAVRQEAQFQQIAAKCGIAPQVYAVVGPGGNLDVTGPKIIMGLVGERVIDRITRQNGILTAAQQFSLLKTALKLDACGVRHNDPNPLNFMFSTKDSDDVMWIDYGFAKRQPTTAFNNLNSIRTLLRGGMQGIVSRGQLKPQGATIIDGWLSKLQEGGGTLTEEQVSAIERNEEA